MLFMEHVKAEGSEIERVRVGRSCAGEIKWIISHSWKMLHEEELLKKEKEKLN